MTYEARWYRCELSDAFERDEPPDFSKIPEAKRERVRAAWTAKPVPTATWWLWGPQIEWYRRQPQYTVRVLS